MNHLSLEIAVSKKVESILREILNFNRFYLAIHD